jgi:uncharacterized membrane-anchored protein
LNVEEEIYCSEAMNNKITFALFAVMLLAQWLVPSKLIYDSEKTSALGTTFKFRIRPVDPYDPFRGKYITLNFEDDQAVRDTLEDFVNDQSAFVLVEEDSMGIAKVKNVSNTIFLDGNYFEATVNYSTRLGGDSLQSVSLNFPFNKFFLEETVAPEAEVAYSETRNDTIPAFALVSILDGKAVLRDVIIRDSSIADVVKERLRKK